MRRAPARRALAEAGNMNFQLPFGATAFRRRVDSHLKDCLVVALSVLAELLPLLLVLGLPIQLARALERFQSKLVFVTNRAHLLSVALWKLMFRELFLGA